MSKTNRKKSVFPQKQSKREEGVGCLSIRLFRPLVLKKAQSKLAEKEPKRELSTKKKELKKEDEKAQTEKASFFQANGKREKQRILTKESRIKLVNSLKRALSKKKREVRERLLRSRKAE